MAGVAIGLGNIWRFPYMMGQYGGSAFLVTFLLISLGFGVPGLMAEWSLGRHTRSGAWGAYRFCGLPLARFWSTILVVTVTMAASYYGVVIGWVLQQAVAFAAAGFSRNPVESFASLTSSVPKQFVFLVISIVGCCLVLALGVRRGIERVSKIAMPVFFLLFVVLIVRSLTLEGAAAGLGEFLKPQWENFSGRTAMAALGQAVFSLGLGGTLMVRYGSYLKESQDIPRGAVMTAVADVAAALMAGLIIFPAVFAFGMDLAGGPSLMFDVMPQVFERMPVGTLFGATFFFSVFIVAMLSLVAAYEVVATATSSAFGWSRGTSLVVLGAGQAILAVPAYLFGGYIARSDLIWGSTLMPFGAGVAVVALAWFVGQGKALEEMRRNSKLPVPTFLFYWIKYVLPVAILAILVFGWVG